MENADVCRTMRSMKTVIRILSAIAIVVSVSWVYYDTIFESILAVVVSISAMLSTFVDWASGQQQTVSKNSSGIQAGRDVISTNTHGTRKESSKK